MEGWSSQNVCVVCILKPEFLMLFKFLYIDTNCKHSSLKSCCEPFELKRPKLFSWFIVFYVTMLFLAFSINMVLLKPVCMENGGDCFIMISNSILIFTGTWITKEFFRNLEHWLKEINKWSHILDELKNEMSLFHELKQFSLECSQISAMLVLLITVLYAGIFLILALSNLQKGIIFIISESTVFFVSFIQISVFNTITIDTIIIKKIIKLVEILFCKKMKSNINIHESIDQYRKYLWSSSYTWRTFNETINPSAVICLICFIVLIILNIYSLFIESSNMSSNRLLILFIQVTAVSFMMVCTVTALDQERLVSRNI